MQKTEMTTQELRMHHDNLSEILRHDFPLSHHERPARLASVKLLYANALIASAGDEMEPRYNFINRAALTKAKEELALVSALLIKGWWL